MTTKTPTELAYAINDLRAVIAAQEDMARAGHPVPKLGQYRDELFGLLRTTPSPRVAA